MKISKVIECYNNAETYQCPRCNQYYCNHCHESKEVDFDVMDKSERYNTPVENWNGKVVCHYCYNQLIDINEGEKHT